MSIRMLLISALSFSAFVANSAFADKFPTVITGKDAEMFYRMADDPDLSESEPRDFECGCHYTKEGDQFNMAFCDSRVGFINSPVREILSQILISNRTPKFMEFDRYAIGVYYKCVKSPAYSCEFEDLEDFKKRSSK